MSYHLEFQNGYIPRYNIRTDLALEAEEIVRGKSAAGISGLAVETLQDEGITVNRSRIETIEAARQLGKAQGYYITLEAPGLRENDSHLQDRLSDILARELQNMPAFAGQFGETVLVVGLGNWNVTPDALGPRVVEDLLVTRHLFQLENNPLGSGYRSVCALSPGVMGITGIETGEIIQAVVARINPGIVIAIDALAAHRLERLHTTVQIADSGVSPGSGVGNRRLGITRETIGVPVIAIGVPTVVEASTIAGEAMELLVGKYKKEAPETEALRTSLEKLSWDQRQEMISELLEPYVGRLMVTPKEIDTYIDDIALVVAAGLNLALHPKIRQSAGSKYLQ